jgi:KilA-N domain/Meiotically up-regulated gene 113
MKELVLLESRTARQDRLADMNDDRALLTINKAKALLMASWQGTGIATTEQMADYYEVPEDTVQKVYDQNRGEFALDWLLVANSIDEKLFKTRAGRDFAVMTKESKLSYLSEKSWTTLVPIKPIPVVYFILDSVTNLIKIGYTHSLNARFSGFQCGNPNPLEILGYCSGGKKEETRIHREFAEYRVTGEWFKDIQVIRDFIASQKLAELPIHPVSDDIYWTPRAVLRLGLLLDNSLIAQKVRDVLEAELPAITPEIVGHEFENHKVSQRSKDGYVNLTQLCKAGGKLVADYIRLTTTQELLTALALDMGIHITDNHAGSGALVEIIQGIGKAQGTWAHPEVAIDCAQWVSVQLRIWANRTLVKISAGQLAEQNPKAIADLTDRIAKLEATFQHKALPKASVDPVPGEIQPLTERQCITRLIRGYVYRHNMTHIGERETEQEVTRWMYRELKYRHKFDVYARIKNSKYKRKIDLIEAEGFLPQLHAICNHFLAT